MSATGILSGCCQGWARAVSDLIFDVVKVLGGCPDLGQLEQLAAGVRRTGDRDAVRLLDAAANDSAVFRELADACLRRNVSPFTLLDLVTEFSSPGSNRRVRAGHRPGRVRG
jgi:hypothetical protein